MWQTWHSDSCRPCRQRRLYFEVEKMAGDGRCRRLDSRRPSPLCPEREGRICSSSVPGLSRHAVLGLHPLDPSRWSAPSVLTPDFRRGLPERCCSWHVGARFLRRQGHPMTTRLARKREFFRFLFSNEQPRRCRALDLASSCDAPASTAQAPSPPASARGSPALIPVARQDGSPGTAWERATARISDERTSEGFRWRDCRSLAAGVCCQPSSTAAIKHKDIRRTPWGQQQGRRLRAAAGRDIHWHPGLSPTSSRLEHTELAGKTASTGPRGAAGGIFGVIGSETCYF